MLAQPYYDLDGITLHKGDALNVLDSIQDNSIPLVVTSPPYNLGGKPWPHLGHWKPGDGSGGQSKWRNGSDASNGVQYGGHDDAMPWEEYVAWQRRLLSVLWCKITDIGAIFYNHKPRVIGAKLWLPLELIPPEVILRQIVIWARPGGMNFNPTAFVPTHEWIMILAKDKWRLKSTGVSGLGDVWRMTPDKNKHPAPFPLSLPMKAIEATGADLVLDPFAGSGTTLRAAKDSGCHAIGIEKDPRWCELAVSRLEQGVLF